MPFSKLFSALLSGHHDDKGSKEAKQQKAGAKRQASRQLQAETLPVAEYLPEESPRDRLSPAECEQGKRWSPLFSDSLFSCGAIEEETGPLSLGSLATPPVSALVAAHQQHPSDAVLTRQLTPARLSAVGRQSSSDTLPDSGRNTPQPRAGSHYAALQALCAPPPAQPLPRSATSLNAPSASAASTASAATRRTTSCSQLEGPVGGAGGRGAARASPSSTAATPAASEGSVKSARKSIEMDGPRHSTDAAKAGCSRRGSTDAALARARTHRSLDAAHAHARGYARASSIDIASAIMAMAGTATGSGKERRGAAGGRAATAGARRSVEMPYGPEGSVEGGSRRGSSLCPSRNSREGVSGSSATQALMHIARTSLEARAARLRPAEGHTLVGGEGGSGRGSRTSTSKRPSWTGQL